MPQITGTLQTILDDDPSQGSIEVALCGYGSQVPRVNGAALAARVTDDGVEIEDDGTFAFDVAGNDEIEPQGTYYTITVKDDNGDIVQANAYQFLSTQADYDLDSTDPFDPSLSTPPPVPPLILNLLEEVPYDPNAVFSGDKYTAWSFDLSGDCDPTFTNLLDGNLYTIIILQEGSFAFNWPDNVNNAAPVPTDSDVFIQTFMALGGDLFAIAPATYFP
jgi:hypothetical protein